MREIFQRLQRETPRFFKRLQAICLALMGISGSIIALETTHNITLPSVMIEICKYLLVAGTVAGGVGSLTVKGGYKG
jgi:hypothetical protein